MKNHIRCMLIICCWAECWKEETGLSKHVFKEGVLYGVSGGIRASKTRTGGRHYHRSGFLLITLPLFVYLWASVGQQAPVSFLCVWYITWWPPWCLAGRLWGSKGHHPQLVMSPAACRPFVFVIRILQGHHSLPLHRFTSREFQSHVWL